MDLGCLDSLAVLFSFFFAAVVAVAAVSAA
jgi:hypothetical protein